MRKLATHLRDLPLPVVRYVPSLDDYQIAWNYTTDKVCEGKTLLLGIPGCFFPSATHKFLPEYLRHAAELRALGQFDRFVVLAPNDPYVVQTFAQEVDALHVFEYLCDFQSQLAKSLHVDFPSFGQRSRLFRGIVDEGRVTQLVVEDNWQMTAKTRVHRLLQQLLEAPPYPNSVYSD